MRRTIAALAGLATALTLTACGPDTGTNSSSDKGSTSQASDSPVAVGQTVTAKRGDWDSTVTIVSATWHAAGQGDYAQPPKNGAYLVIDVEWSGKGSYNSLYLTFRADTGVESDATSGIFGGFEPSLDSGDLAGSKVKGNVAFDAAQGPGVVILSDPLGQSLGSWTIPA